VTGDNWLVLMDYCQELGMTTREVGRVFTALHYLAEAVRALIEGDFEEKIQGFLNGDKISVAPPVDGLSIETEQKIHDAFRNACNEEVVLPAGATARRFGWEITGWRLTNFGVWVARLYRNLPVRPLWDVADEWGGFWENARLPEEMQWDINKFTHPLTMGTGLVPIDSSVSCHGCRWQSQCISHSPRSVEWPPNWTIPEGFPGCSRFKKK